MLSILKRELIALGLLSLNLVGFFGFGFSPFLSFICLLTLVRLILVRFRS